MKDPIGFAKRALIAALALLTSPGAVHAAPEPATFTIAVIPDTQFYLDYTHQKAEGFPFDARDMFRDQMRYIAAHARSAGGDIAFATSVGDIWEHQTRIIDADHARQGMKVLPNPFLDAFLAPTDKTRTVEMPAAEAGYRILDGKLPFSVVPGNHDYDAMWTDPRWPPAADPRKAGDNPRPYGMLHPGGLANWTSIFGAASSFFAGKPWYVASFHDGADSAQTFAAGGYLFLHIGLEMAPSDEVLAWAAKVIRQHPGRPTIVSTHDHLDTSAQRLPNPVVDMRAVDPRHNNPEQVWEKFLSRHDQIFLVLSGHEHGQARRIDNNVHGHQVFQLLADYQARAQSAYDAGLKPDPSLGVGDGWLRLMTFDMRSPVPRISVRTYSTHYRAFSSEIASYADWYHAQEQPGMSADAFLAQDAFNLDLLDFRSRFGAPFERDIRP